jgi:hypothetical protein
MTRESYIRYCAATGNFWAGIGSSTFPIAAVESRKASC